jgi:hypothetical protein
MIKISRAPLPRELDERLTGLTKELESISADKRIANARGIWRRTSIRTNVRAPLSKVLADMAPGREHCMYCGDNQGTDIDHYEPIARNPLRTFVWLNHLLACSVCNSHQKRDQFPVDTDGNPLLIDPTTEDPFDHLLLTLSLGVYQPITHKGKVTIDVCDLNRALLIRGRVQARRVVELCLDLWQRGTSEGNATIENEAVLTVREQPFADVCQSMLRQATAPNAGDIFVDNLSILDLLLNPKLRAALLG